MSNSMKWLARLYLTVMYLLIFAPIVVMVVFSFNASKVGYHWGGLSTTWYQELFANEGMIQAAINSVVLAVVAATVTTLIGALTALSFQRYDFNGKGVLQGLLFVLMMSPEIVLAISLLALFLMLGIKLGFVTLLLAHITFCLPFVVITVSARLSSMDNSVLEAARDLGASEMTMIRTVLLPIIMPAVMAGWVLAFTLSLDDVVVSTFNTGADFEILPLQIYSMVRVGVKPEVNAVGTILLVISLIGLLLSQWLLFKKR
ncbi:spermidine/putrescine ABC transporter permease PotC [Psychrobacter lutiphocae]|uniref:spermidine/putrescine ABC transporter permease PotC n=1 Tax=Psychrobacter lutiphocae TaxID=540500 RepID=UPI0003A063F5|nr:spermidine/putrescine ABC transporter permease PotC [Psychrobacter lutiphocae]